MNAGAGLAGSRPRLPCVPPAVAPTVLPSHPSACAPCAPRVSYRPIHPRASRRRRRRRRAPPSMHAPPRDRDDHERGRRPGGESSPTPVRAASNRDHGPTVPSIRVRSVCSACILPSHPSACVPSASPPPAGPPSIHAPPRDRDDHERGRSPGGESSPTPVRAASSRAHGPTVPSIRVRPVGVAAAGGRSPGLGSAVSLGQSVGAGRDTRSPQRAWKARFIVAPGSARGTRCLAGVCPVDLDIWQDSRGTSSAGYAARCRVSTISPILAP